MTRQGIEQFAVLDCEASSLSKQSWPIEVGLSWIENGKIVTWSSLIQPASEWDLSDWSQQSAAVHKIPYELLSEAPVASQVARDLVMVLDGRTLVSDAPKFDHHWLTRLLDTHVSFSPIQVGSFDNISFTHFDCYALDVLYETLERHPAPHRAGPDSARLARSWQRVKQIEVDPKHEKSWVRPDRWTL